MRSISSLRELLHEAGNYALEKIGYSGEVEKEFFAIASSINNPRFQDAIEEYLKRYDVNPEDAYESVTVKVKEVYHEGNLTKIKVSSDVGVEEILFNGHLPNLEGTLEVVIDKSIEYTSPWRDLANPCYHVFKRGPYSKVEEAVEVRVGNNIYTRKSRLGIHDKGQL